MNLERMFDLLVHMRENPQEDYVFDKKRNLTLNYRQQAVVLKKSLQAFMQGVAVKDHDGKIIQAFSGSSDLPVLTKDVFDVTQEMPIFDTFWQLAFKGIPLKRGQLAWEIANVAAGLVFELVPEFGKAKFYGISGSKVDAKIDKYGAGIGVSWEMIEGRKLYQFVDLMGQVRARLNDLWADVHYGLLQAAGAAHVITWQGAVTDPVLDRDIRTINVGYETIGNLVKNKGYGDVANATMYLYASPLLKSRISMVMRSTAPDIIRGRAASSGVQILEYNVEPRFTWNPAVLANTAVLVLPKNKIQNSMYMQELGLSERDIETLSEMRTYWSAFGAIVADTEQCSQLAFS